MPICSNVFIQISLLISAGLRLICRRCVVQPIAIVVQLKAQPINLLQRFGNQRSRGGGGRGRTVN
jgi:hypothetical protein